MKVVVEGVTSLIADLEKFRSLTSQGKDEAVRKTALYLHKQEINLLDMMTHRRTGRLAQIAIAFPEQATATVEPTAPHAPYIEFGTKPHEIRIKHKKVLARRNLGAVATGGALYTIFGKRVWHPGTKARPFVKLATDLAEVEFEKNLNAALDAALAQ